MDNKYILQGYTLTTAGDSYNLFAQRGILAVVEVAQAELTGAKLKGIASDALISKSEIGEQIIDIRVSDIMQNAGYENYKVAKKGLEELFDKKMIWRQDNVVHYRHFIEKIDFDTLKGWARLTISEEVWRMILDYSQGYRKFELEKAMKMRSTYSLRLYELISGKTEPITYSIAQLRAMFDIGKKQYALTKDFIARTIDSAKAELDKVAPYTFTYKPVYENKEGRGRKKITALTFYPKRQPRNEDRELIDNETLKAHTGALLDREVKRILTEAYEFTDKEIQRNLETILQAQKICDLKELLIKVQSRAYKNYPKTKAYIIGCLKEEIRAATIEAL